MHSDPNPHKMPSQSFNSWLSCSMGEYTLPACSAPFPPSSCISYSYQARCTNRLHFSARNVNTLRLPLGPSRRKRLLATHCLELFAKVLRDARYPKFGLLFGDFGCLELTFARARSLPYAREICCKISIAFGTWLPPTPIGPRQWPPSLRNMTHKHRHFLHGKRQPLPA